MTSVHIHYPDFPSSMFKVCRLGLSFVLLPSGIETRDFEEKELMQQAAVAASTWATRPEPPSSAPSATHSDYSPG